MATHSSTLTWEIHGQRSLVGYRPRGRKEPDTTEHSINYGTYLKAQQKVEHHSSPSMMQA